MKRSAPKGESSFSVQKCPGCHRIFEVWAARQREEFRAHRDFCTAQALLRKKRETAKRGKSLAERLEERGVALPEGEREILAQAAPRLKFEETPLELEQDSYEVRCDSQVGRGEKLRYTGMPLDSHRVKFELDESGWNPPEKNRDAAFLSRILDAGDGLDHQFEIKPRTFKRKRGQVTRRNYPARIFAQHPEGWTPGRVWGKGTRRRGGPLKKH